MFKFVKNDNGDNFPIIEQKPATAATYAVGEALKYANGKMTKATGTDAVEYICAEAGTKAAGEMLSVNPVYHGQVWEVPFSVDGSALAAGAKVTVASDSAQITATTTNGTVELMEAGKTANGKVLVRF